MKKVIVLLALSIPLLVGAQQKGIHWTEGLTWGQVTAKAKAENKYIFLDCYATWCQPCHAMDKDVYPNEEVGKVINEKYISVKVQMDKTKYDNEFVKKWYIDAKQIESNYAVKSFPTFLFFNPDGTPMHRAVGYRSSNEFITLVDEAFNPDKQYYALLKNYQPGKLDTSELKGLSRALRNSGGELAVIMAIEYLTRIPKSELQNDDNINLMCEFSTTSQMQEFVGKYLSKISGKEYSSSKNLKLIRNFSSMESVRDLILGYVKRLNKGAFTKNLPLLSVFKKETRAKEIADGYIIELNQNKIFTKENLTFLKDFTKSSKDKGFNIFYLQGDRVDKVIDYKGYARSVVMNVIIEEEYNHYYKIALQNGTDNVPWEPISKSVKAKYGDSIATLLDIHMKATLYENLTKQKNKYWPEYIKYYIQKVEKFGTDTTGPQHKLIDVLFINNFVYRAIFYHSRDTNEMKTGLRWMEGVIRRNPTEANNIDTYANLMYKMGRIEEAIQWQEKAVEVALKEKQEWVLSSLKTNLSKMKKGEPTWIKESAN